MIVSVIESGAYSHIVRFMPLYLRTVGVNASSIPPTLGILAALPFVFGLPLIPLWGVWADRYGQRLVIARSAIVEAAVFAGLGFSRSLLQAGVCLLLVGFQLGNTGIMLAALRRVSPAGRVGLVISLFGVGPAIGFALGPIAGGFLVDRGVIDLHGLFLADGVLSAAAALLLMLSVREMRPASWPGASAFRLARTAVRLAFTTPVTVDLFLIFGLGYLAQQTAGPFYPLLVQRLHGGGAGLATAIGAVFGGAALAGVLLSPIAGLIGDRIGYRPVLTGALALGAASLAAMTAAPNLVILAILGTALGGAGAAVTAMVFALLATRVPEERRTATLNLVYVPLYAAGVAGGAMGSLLVHAGLDSVFRIAALPMLAAAVVAVVRVRRAA
ncbi:MAG: MFS transporter [Candidatus Dormibacteria bacterium]